MAATATPPQVFIENIDETLFESVPRKSCLWLQVPIERKLGEAISDIEILGSDENLSKAQELISKALLLISDYIDNDIYKRSRPLVSDNVIAQ